MSGLNKILVLGANGMLGTHVRWCAHNPKRRFRERFVFCSKKFWGERKLHRYLDAVKPATVINGMGYKGGSVLRHFFVNACLPRAIANWAEGRRVCVILISTNAVFKPSPTRRWRPGDRRSPRTSYEISKALGEDPRALVIRASCIGYDPGGGGVFNRWLRGAEFKDRRWNGVTALVLARVILKVARRFGGFPKRGVLHVYCGRPTSFSRVARLLGSRSKAIDRTRDARLLAGGLSTGPIERQVRGYRRFLKNVRC